MIDVSSDSPRGGPNIEETSETISVVPDKATASIVPSIEEELLPVSVADQNICGAAEVEAQAVLSTPNLVEETAQQPDELPPPPAVPAYQQPVDVRDQRGCETKRDIDAAAATIQHAFTSSLSRKRLRETGTSDVNCAITDQALLALEVDDLPYPTALSASTILATAAISGAVAAPDDAATPFAVSAEAAMPTPVTSPMSTTVPQEQLSSPCDNTSVLGCRSSDDGLTVSLGEMDKLFLEAKCAAERQAEQEARLKFNEWVVKKTSLREAIDESLRGYPEMHQKAHEIRLLFEKERDEVLDKLARSRQEAERGRCAYGRRAENSAPSSFQFQYDVDDIDEDGERGDKENEGRGGRGLFRPIPFGQVSSGAGLSEKKGETNVPAENAYSFNKNIKPFSPPSKAARLH